MARGRCPVPAARAGGSRDHGFLPHAVPRAGLRRRARAHAAGLPALRGVARRPATPRRRRARPHRVEGAATHRAARGSRGGDPRARARRAQRERARRRPRPRRGGRRALGPRLGGIGRRRDLGPGAPRVAAGPPRPPAPLPQRSARARERRTMVGTAFRGRLRLGVARRPQARRAPRADEPRAPNAAARPLVCPRRQQFLRDPDRGGIRRQRAHRVHRGRGAGAQAPARHRGLADVPAAALLPAERAAAAGLRRSRSRRRRDGDAHPPARLRPLADRDLVALRAARLPGPRRPTGAGHARGGRGSPRWGSTSVRCWATSRWPRA